MSTEQATNFPPELTESLQQTHRVTVLTGAGTSAESGVPTFRDAQTGMWAKYDPQQLATPSAFQRNPRLVWEWYTWRRGLIARAQPNAGHYALVEMEQRVPNFVLITQNVDGMHQRAGNRHVIELHGNLHRMKRFDDGVIVEKWEEPEEPPPRCPQTGSLLRPDVVWFGESLPEDALQRASQAAAQCEVFLAIGTSGVVQPSASLPYIARRAGATMIVINPDATPHVTEATYFLCGPSARLLPALVEATWG